MKQLSENFDESINKYIIYINIKLLFQKDQLLKADYNSKNKNRFFNHQLLGMTNLNQESQSTKLQIAGVVIFLAFYTILSSFLQHRNFPIHRGAVASMIGVGTGLIIRLSSLDTYNSITKLNQTIIFLILLPTILFAKGYTFKKGAFLANFKFIVLFGIIGTFISFVVISLLMYAANTLNLVRDAKDITNYRSLSTWQILLLSACLCSIDTDASQQAVEENKYPKLNAIIMGEDTFKDCATIVLFRSLLRLQNMSTPSKFVFYWYTPFQVILNFLVLISGSFLLGTAAAAFTAYLFKRLRFLLKDEGVSQTSVLFLLGFATYVLAQCMNLSGIISILCYGVVLNRYNYFNLSLAGRQSSRTTFLFAANICQGILFLIMGIMVWQIQWDQQAPTNPITHSYIFCLIVFVIIIVGRIINVYILWFVAKCISPIFRLNKYQLLIIFISGLSKGATPFALFTSVEFLDSSSKYAKNEGLVLKTTIIIIVMFCTVILNSIVPKIFEVPLRKLRSKAKQQLIQKTSPNKQESKLKKLAESHFRKFQQDAIRPFLIYNYETRRTQIKQTNQKMKQSNIRKSIKQLEQQEYQFSKHNKNDQSLLSIQNL